MELVRKRVQIIFSLLMNANWAFPFTRSIYQGPLKIFCAPGLNCYSCPASTTYCPIGSLQNILAGVRLSLENSQYFFGLSVIGSMGVLGALFGRMICGWACPFGFIQELLHKIPSPKFIIPHPLNYGKYFMLFVVVILLPLLVVDEFGGSSPWFCKLICPAGTLEAGLPMLLLQPDLTSTIGLLFYNKLTILILILLWSILASRPFCRTICPLGGFYALVNRYRLVKLTLDTKRCTNCKACHHVCPMEVKFNENPNDPECISCMACLYKACKFEAISIEIGGIPMQSPRRAQGHPTQKTVVPISQIPGE
ncbi:MAG: 4Fe-4S binding protein [Desulfocapsaceae bacterium]|nr:4Fe-4S binding protein [Desulfocapsaceae bacterium]